MRRFVCSTLCLMTLCWTSAWGAPFSRLSGRILNEQQQPIPHAQVFMEQGLLAALVRVTSDSTGHFEFTQVRPGTVGIIAHSPGLAFNGLSLIVGTGDVRNNLDIVLPPSAQLTGRILSPRKKPIAQASVTRLLLQHAKVGIPYAKLIKSGFQSPKSNAKGQFIIPNLPANEVVALKVSHPKHAQGIATGIRVGEAPAIVTLSRGVLVSGNIQAQKTMTAVPRAAVIFRNVRPPRDTTITQAGADGVYLLRLKPGEYTYESIGASHTSITKARIVITGALETEALDILVAAKVRIEGKVVNAKTGKGIAGARVRLNIQGKANAEALTGSQGLYSFFAPAGTATLQFIQAPGYLRPQTPAYSIPLMSDEDAAAPIFWLMPLPTYSLAVVDAAQQPLAHAIVQVLDPPQVGWRRTDADGLVAITLASLPDSGRVVGYVEHPTLPQGTAFSIDTQDAQEAIVQLLPQRALQGRVVNAQGQGLAAWTVACRIASAGTPNPITLWTTGSDSDGRFDYPGVIEGIPLLYSASYENEEGLQSTAPMLFTLQHDSLEALPDLVAMQGESGKTLLGKKFPWRSLDGEALSQVSEWDGVRIVVFASAIQLDVVLETLEQQAEILAPLQSKIVLVSENPTSLISSSVALLTGKSPATAQVYVVSKDHRVIAESNEFPALSRLRKP